MVVFVLKLLHDENVHILAVAIQHGLAVHADDHVGFRT
jgi:hypothetical protein